MGCCCSKVTETLFKSTLDFQPLSRSEATSPMQDDDTQIDTDKVSINK